MFENFPDFAVFDKILRMNKVCKKIQKRELCEEYFNSATYLDVLGTVHKLLNAWGRGDI